MNLFFWRKRSESGSDDKKLRHVSNDVLPDKQDDVVFQSKQEAFEQYIKNNDSEKIDAWLSESGKYYGDMNEITPLHIAAGMNAVSCLGAVVNKTNLPIDALCYIERRAYTPLAWAVKNRHAEFAETILEMGADPDAHRNSNLYNVYTNPLYLAVENRDPKMVKLLLSHHANPNSQHYDNRNCFAVAMQGGEYGIAHLLLEAGAKPFGITDAQRRLAPPEIQPLLKAAYAKLSPQEWSCATSGLGVIDRDGNKIADPDDLFWPNARKIYMLIDEARLSLPEVPEQNLIAGADSEASPVVLPRLPAGSQVQNGLIEGIRYGRINNIKRALEAGANVNPEAPAPQPVFEAITHARGTVILEMLDRAGADFELLNEEAQTPLIFAAANGKEDAVAFLLAKKVCLETIDDNGMNALHYAVKERHTGIAVQLLSVGMDPDGTTVIDQTPLDLAMMNVDQGMVDLLQKHGARRISPEMRKWVDLEYRPAPQNRPAP